MAEQIIDHEQSLFNQLMDGDSDMFTCAHAMHMLCEKYRYTQASLAKRIGVSQSTVGNKIRLLQFLQNERALIREFSLSERHARVLLRILPPRREKLIATAGNLHLTVQQTEDLVEKYAQDSQPFSINRFNEQKESIQHYFSNEQLNADTFLSRTQSASDHLRTLGYKTTCLTESGEGWHRITVTIVE